MRFALTFAAVVLSAFCCNSAQVFAQSSNAIRYDVTLNTLTSASVTVQLPEAPGSFYMSTAATGKDDGFASYVRDFTIDIGAQHLTPVRSGAVWKLDTASKSPATAHYTVDLTFTQQRWEVGNEQAGFTDGKGTFVVSKALFLESDLPGFRTVAFHLQPGWKLLTPWHASAAATYSFPRDEVLGDLLAFGDLTSSSTTSGAFRATIVTFGAFKSQQLQIASVVNAVTAQFNNVFPGTAPVDYLVVLIPGAEVDGEAYAHGFASTDAAPLRMDEKIVWANGIAHEMFHYWCGRQIHADTGSDGRDTRLEWFTEGFTEYHANMALIRSHQTSVADFLQKVATNVGQYQYFLVSGLFNGVTIEKAGARKGSYRFGVYSSGWVMAFVLDQELRAATHGKKNLETLMRALLLRTSSQPLTLDILLDTVESIGGKPLRNLLAHAIDSRDSVQPERYLEALGLHTVGQSYQAEFYLHLNPTASPAQTQLRRTWAGF